MQVTTNEASFDLSIPDSFVMARIFRAPRPLVWSALTEPTRLAQWYGPNGFQTETEVLDLRPGGEWVFAWVKADGTRIPSRMVFVEIDPPARLLSEQRMPQQGEATPEKIQRLTTLEEVAEGTLLTLKMTFSSAEVRDSALKTGGTEGSKQILARLAEYLEETQKGAA
jgi:uncharacterized protein YndB with AHSA1/START domain